MGRAPCCSKVGLHRGPWTAREDALLVKYIQAHGEGQWRSLPKNAGLLRCGKSCRLRWMNYLRPDIKRGNISEEEEELIIKLHSLLGNRWSLIAGRLPGRTDNEIKNYWNTHLSKRLRSQGTDPNTHKTLSQVDLAKQYKSSKKRWGGNSKKNNQVDKKNKGVIMEEKNEGNTNVERERSKVHLPKPVRVTSVMSLNNHGNGSFGIATSHQHLAFESDKDVILDVGPWLPNNYNEDDNQFNHIMMMGQCGGNVDFDSIQNYYNDMKATMPDHKNQQFEKLYEEYLKLIEADDDRHRSSNDTDPYHYNFDNDNHGDVTESFLL